jgi:hypothetical protein
MKTSIIQEHYERSCGILRLLPAFVTMRFNQAGGRLHLHPDDWYPRGVQAGSVKERWLSSVLEPRKDSSEGLSFVLLGNQPEDRCSLPEAVDALGADLIGDAYKQRYGTWPVHAKFFDYNQPLFLHLHLDDISAARIGVTGKPEAYYFPVQLNNHPGTLPITYFGFSPEVTREEVLGRLRDWEKRDFAITELSRAYRLQPGTGWYTPPGVLHAPGSLLTYEVQWNSASGAVFQNVLSTSGEIYGLGSLTGSVPQEQREDWDAILNLIDWPVNVDPAYREHYFRPGEPVPCSDGAREHDAQERGAHERWIVYGNPYFAAKELSVAPGMIVTITDPLPYGCVVIQGHGTIGPHLAEAPTLLRYDQPSADEFFVGLTAARAGVQIANHSPVEPLVILKHFGPGYPGMP